MRYRYGSFLKKDKASLERLASAKVVDPNGPRHSKNFIFKRVSPDKPKPTTKRPQVNRSMSQVVTPSAKRPDWTAARVRTATASSPCCTEQHPAYAVKDSNPSRKAG
ncbi:PREDICTED: claspin-like [Branchiostoma belcheri]|uniref:Claspin-like n=1 Tax=Branchiostoma belcheri TaxID=7741 RepID=A0A6P4Y6X7_BRABE|nr:PREDICTED: claspin-like [Branchiostoma belcheri]